MLGTEVSKALRLVKQTVDNSIVGPSIVSYILRVHLGSQSRATPSSILSRLVISCKDFRAADSSPFLKVIPR